MTSILEAFERGTSSFNAHDLDAFAAVPIDDVVFQTPGGMRGQGKSARVEFFAGFWDAFPHAQVDVHHLHITEDMAVEEERAIGSSPTAGVCPSACAPWMKEESR